MSTSSTTAFVTAATGTQGEAVARHLRAIGWTVHATARNMDAPVVHSLQSLGVEVTPGDWEDEAALTAAIAGCSSLFLNLMPKLADFTSEVPHARRILAIAKAAGVKHVVYSSGLSVNNPEKRAYYIPDSMPAEVLGWKREIEGLVRAAGFEAWTILRGAFFMPNFLLPKVGMYPGLRETNKWTTALTAETRMPMVDTEDIAKFAVAAFLDPGRFHRQEIGIASELRSPDELMELLGEATGRDMRAVFLTDEEIEAQKDTNIFVVAQLMSRDLGDCVDIDEATSWGIPLGTFKQFLERETKALKETYP